jgi:hypothetical protein
VISEKLTYILVFGQSQALSEFVHNETIENIYDQSYNDRCESLKIGYTFNLPSIQIRIMRELDRTVGRDIFYVLGHWGGPFDRCIRLIRKTGKQTRHTGIGLFVAYLKSQPLTEKRDR